MAQTRMTRRHALKFPPIIAAALALPLGNTAEATEPEIVHPELCFHDKYRSPVTAREYIEAEHRFGAMLSPAQHRAWMDLETLHAEHRVTEEDPSRSCAVTSPAWRGPFAPWRTTSTTRGSPTWARAGTTQRTTRTTRRAVRHERRHLRPP
jgi:hypothetical protein